MASRVGFQGEAPPAEQEVAGFPRAGDCRERWRELLLCSHARRRGGEGEVEALPCSCSFWKTRLFLFSRPKENWGFLRFLAWRAAAAIGGDQIYRPQADVPIRVLQFTTRRPGEEATQPLEAAAWDPHWSEEGNRLDPQVWNLVHWPHWLWLLARNARFGLSQCLLGAIQGCCLGYIS